MKKFSKNWCWKTRAYEIPFYLQRDRNEKKKNELQPLKNCNSFATKNSFYCINTLSEHINPFLAAINSKTITKPETPLENIFEFSGLEWKILSK